MDPAGFETHLESIREQIAALPLQQRAALDALVDEAVQRHREIAHASRQSRSALQRLESASTRLDAALEALVRKSERARAHVRRLVHQAPPPSAN